MDKKTSFVLYPADFLATVHNFKKSQIADLIIALCEINFYGEVSFKLSEYVGAPSFEEVAIYCKESGYTIDPVAFVKWNEARGWMNGKKYIVLDWRKAVRKWFCKEKGLSFSEMKTFSDICGDVLGNVKAVQNG